MYEKTFGLEAKPFSLLPDPTYLFQSRAHQLGSASACLPNLA